MNPFQWALKVGEVVGGIVTGVRDIVIGVRDARRANVRDAQIAILSQQAANRAAERAGHEKDQPPPRR